MSFSIILLLRLFRFILPIIGWTFQQQ
uniref:Uncharacterized protein n=1 Tax=Arundo donax TaxID=35708 RepID=A0A0A9HGV8_ARUDO